MKGRHGRIGYFFLEHLRHKKNLYVAFLLALIVGLVLGIVLQFTSSFGSALLSDDDQVIFDFIAKDVSVLDFFLSKILDVVIALALVFVCSLSIYSSFLVFVFLTYQGMILSLVCCQIVASYGFLGVLNVVLILLPVNLALFAFMFFEGAVCISRALMAKRYISRDLMKRPFRLP